VAEFKAVLFDWRGTLVRTLPELEWVKLALERAGRSGSDQVAAEVLARIEGAPSVATLWGAGVDADAALHRQTYLSVFAEAGLDPELAHALYEVESDGSLNPFADDAASVLSTLKARGVRTAIISDIHFDLRPVFRRAGLDEFVDHFVLSFEHGTQKPEPGLFQIALAALGLASEDVLMVGDRSGYDGAAVELGIVTLLLPPLRSIDDRRLHLVERVLGG
jgi:HAD superfamily hydrolase (TIGR01549 family)